MSIFSAIMSKIFHHHGQQPEPAQAAATRPAAPQPAPQAASPQPQSSTPTEPVDVEAVLAEVSAHKGEPLNWRTSIVDLLKLLDLDSSLAARKELANELNVHVGEDGSSEENLALHKAVMQKLAENGGKVPEALKAA